MLQSRIRAAQMCRGIMVGEKWRWSSKRYISEEQESASTQGVADTQGYAPIPTGLPADPAMHSSEPPQDGDTGEGLNSSKLFRTVADEPDPLVSPIPPIASSPKLAYTGVGQPSEPNAQQTRRLSSKPRHHSGGAEAHKAQKRAQEADNKEYFKDHKASSLSEVEFADTRKPVTQATDSPTSYYGKEPGLILWKPEQLDTAEDSLLRAVEIWKWNKMRGDPDSPHGRVLRELRGEYW